MRRVRRRLRLLALRLRRRFTWGFALSLALHGAVIALLLLRPTIPQPLPTTQILVDLVRFGEGTGEPAIGAGPETQNSSAAPPPPQMQKHVTTSGTETRQNVGDLLRRAELAHGSPALPSHDGRGGGNSNGVRDGHGVNGGGGGLTLKDFIRAQIERRWQFEGGARREIVVQVRLRIDPDGVVQSAEIVGDRADPEFHAAALGARNAALLSSPLQLPPGVMVSERDITVDLNTKDALQ